MLTARLVSDVSQPLPWDFSTNASKIVFLLFWKMENYAQWAQYRSLYFFKFKNFKFQFDFQELWALLACLLLPLQLLSLFGVGI